MRFPGTTSARGSELTVLRWRLQNQTAVSADTTVEIDMSTAGETAMPFSGSFTVPSGGFFDEARASIAIRTEPALGSAIIGYARRIDINAAGTAFEYEGEAIAVPGATDLYTQIILSGAPRFSTTYLKADLRNGAHETAFLEPPEPTSPAFGVDHPLHAPITWTTGDANAMFTISLTRGTGASALTVWKLSVPTGARQAVFPDLPSNVDAAALFSDTVDGRIGLTSARVVEFPQNVREKGEKVHEPPPRSSPRRFSRRASTKRASSDRSALPADAAVRHRAVAQSGESTNHAKRSRSWP